MGTTRTATSFTTNDIPVKEEEKAIFTNQEISFNEVSISGGDSITIVEGNLSRSDDKSKLEITRFNTAEIPNAIVTTASDTTVSTTNISFSDDF